MTLITSVRLHLRSLTFVHIRLVIVTKRIRQSNASKLLPILNVWLSNTANSTLTKTRILRTTLAHTRNNIEVITIRLKVARTLTYQPASTMLTVSSISMNYQIPKKEFVHTNMITMETSILLNSVRQQKCQIVITFHIVNLISILHHHLFQELALTRLNIVMTKIR